MDVNGITINKINDNLWEIPAFGGMRVPGRIYASENMMKKEVIKDEALKQVINVAHLPGIVKYSLAMPDIHWGYGFPIGGVAATDATDGVISPGGVGYDINCGVRLATTNLEFKNVEKRIKKIVDRLFSKVPTGVVSAGSIRKLSTEDMKGIVEKGSGWAVENGYGLPEDLEATEEYGCLKGADFNLISERALLRGASQAGTLGSGNHFLEIEVVDEIFDEEKAKAFGLFKDQVVVQIHTGSRGFGHQICDESIKQLQDSFKKFGIELPDKQLVCAPLSSDEGKEYLSVMKAAANFAWNNRQIIMALAKQALAISLHASEDELGFRLLYDVSHNIAKMEKHIVDGVERELCVHRKGATRAFAPGSEYLPEKYRESGQPVLIPGDMGRYSFIAAGNTNAMNETFGSSCHGAGRLKSRSQALKKSKTMNLVKEMNNYGVALRASGKKTVGEEMPFAYKDVANVVDVMHNAGVTSKVARLKPIGVIKG